MKVEIEELRAWVDGELDEHRANAVATAAKSDKQLQLAADAMRASQLPYLKAYENAPVPELPDALRNKIAALKNTIVDQGTSDSVPTRVGNAGVKKEGPFQMVGIAASVIVAALLGFLAGSNLSSETTVPSTQTATPSSPKVIAINNQVWHPENFAEAVAAYQSLYVRETLKGTDNSPAAVTRLTERLASQTGMPVFIPELEGYEFVRGQRLAFGDEPLIQLVYIGAEGGPLALCYIPAQDLVAESEHTQNDAGTVTDSGSYYGLNTTEWRHNGRLFVMVSDASKEKLDELSQSALKQWDI